MDYEKLWYKLKEYVITMSANKSLLERMNELELEQYKEREQWKRKVSIIPVSFGGGNKEPEPPEVIIDET